MSADLLVGPVDAQQEWANWKTTHSKSYESEEEEQKRFRVFEENLKDITEHNAKFQAGEVSYSKGLNHFCDLTAEEVPKGGLMMKR